MTEGKVKTTIKELGVCREPEKEFVTDTDREVGVEYEHKAKLTNTASLLLQEIQTLRDDIAGTDFELAHKTQIDEIATQVETSAYTILYGVSPDEVRHLGQGTMSDTRFREITDILKIFHEARTNKPIFSERLEIDPDIGGDMTIPPREKPKKEENKDIDEGFIVSKLSRIQERLDGLDIDIRHFVMSAEGDDEADAKDIFLRLMRQYPSTKDRKFFFQIARERSWLANTIQEFSSDFILEEIDLFSIEELRDIYFLVEDIARFVISKKLIEKRNANFLFACLENSSLNSTWIQTSNATALELN